MNRYRVHVTLTRSFSFPVTAANEQMAEEFMRVMLDASDNDDLKTLAVIDEIDASHFKIDKAELEMSSDLSSIDS